MTACSMMLAIAFKSGWALVPAVVLALAFGAAAGFGNGFLIAKGRISFLAVTLGALSIWQSFSLVVQEGQTVSVFSAPAFGPIHELVTNDIGPIPLLLIFDVALLLIFGGVLRYTTFGRSLFAIGSNEEAARLSGINVSPRPDPRLHDRRARRGPRLPGLGRPPHRGLADARSEPAADRARRGADRRHQLHRRRRRRAGHRDRRRLPRRDPERPDALATCPASGRASSSGSILIIAVGLGVLREKGWSIRRARGANAAVTEGPVR